MKLSTKSITLVTLVTTSIISSMTFAGNTNSASANVQRLKQSNHQINRVLSFTPSVIGNWKGTIVSKGDDAATVIEIDVLPQAGVVKQGSWKFWGSDPNTNKDIVLQSGILSATVGDDNAVTLSLQEKGKAFLKFNTKLKNTKQLSGELVGKTNIKIYLEKGK